MKVSLAGAGVGAVMGAIGRAAVVMYWIGGVALWPVLPSAGIGLLVGAIAGAIAKPGKGALVGFVLSAFVFELFMLTCASFVGDIESVFGRSDSAKKFLMDALPYALLMGLAGAAAGAIGGKVGQGDLKKQ